MILICQNQEKNLTEKLMAMSLFFNIFLNIILNDLLQGYFAIYRISITYISK